MALEFDDGSILIQSPAILEYLEEIYPTPALLPSDPVLKAKVRQWRRSSATMLTRCTMSDHSTTPGKLPAVQGWR
nr:hypothetical protein [Microvirga terrestris]